MLEERRGEDMSECKHGLTSGCAYCHGTAPPAPPKPPKPSKRRTRTDRLSDQMNERVSQLKKRLREIRGR
jgi:hypothetical protein